MSRARTIESLRQSSAVLGTPGLLAAACLGLGALVTVVCLAGVVVSLFASVGAPPKAGATSDDDKVKEYALAVKGFEAQIQGRSLFFTPAPPTPKRAPQPDPGPPAPPPPPPPPSSYGGPEIIALVNDSAWFANGKRLKASEKDDDIQLVSVSAPWSAKIAYKGVEFDVDLFKRDSTVHRPAGSSGWSSSASSKVDTLTSAANVPVKTEAPKVDPAAKPPTEPAKADAPPEAPRPGPSSNTPLNRNRNDRNNRRTPRT